MAASSGSRALQLAQVLVLVAMASNLHRLDAAAVHNSSRAQKALPPCATWCVCKQGPDWVLQRTLDYACGHGADCDPIRPNGACHSPDSVRAHCSYAVNSFFHKMNKAGGTCDFSTTATLTTSDPSSSGCSYPAAFPSSFGSVTPSPAVPKSTPRAPPISGNTPTVPSPYTTTPTPPMGVLGGGGMGVYDDGKAIMITVLPVTSVALCSFITVLMLNLFK